MPLPPHIEAPLPPEFLREVLECVGHPVFVKDRDHRWVWVNASFAELIGAPPTALIGKTDHDFLPAAQADFFYEKDREVFQRGVQVTTEELITGGRKVVHVLATTKVPLRAPSGEITHIVGVIHDITRLKAVEEELRLANEALERRVEERTQALRNAQNALLRKERLVVLGQLSGGLAHQIRTPLTAINNAVAVLRRTLAPTASGDTVEMLSVIAEEIWEANRIITDLIDFARVRPPSLSKVAVATLVEEAIELAQTASPGVTVSTTLPSSLDVMVDQRQTRDALGNVIRNAFEAMPEGGKLTVTATASEGSACISVIDTGPGVNDDALVHLFEPLVTTKSLGLGLGLSTAKVLIENQEGEVHYVKSADGGARFDIRLPLARPEARDGAESGVQDAGPLSGRGPGRGGEGAGEHEP